MRLPLLFLHIAGGMVGLLSGTVAMLYRKGSGGHRLSGDVFVVSMMIMGACGSILALMKHQPDNFFGGLVTFYMVTTGWLTGRNRQQETGLLDWGALVFALMLGGSLLTLSVLVASGQAARQPGVPIGMYFFLAAITLLAAAGDLRMLARGGISGAPRLARHLWRMCFGLFIATGSFVAQLVKMTFMPAWSRSLAAILVLAAGPLVVLLYWMWRVRLRRSVRGLVIRGRLTAASSTPTSPA